MVFCTYKDCKSNSSRRGRNGNKVSFFRFPKVKPLFDIWVRNSGRERVPGKSALYLCDKHFLPDQFRLSNDIDFQTSIGMSVDSIRSTKKMLVEGAEPIKYVKPVTVEPKPIKTAKSRARSKPFTVRVKRSPAIRWKKRVWSKNQVGCLVCNAPCSSTKNKQIPNLPFCKQCKLIYFSQVTRLTKWAGENKEKTLNCSQGGNCVIDYYQSSPRDWCAACHTHKFKNILRRFDSFQVTPSSNDKTDQGYDECDKDVDMNPVVLVEKLTNRDLAMYGVKSPIDEVDIKDEPMDIEFDIDKCVDLPGPSYNNSLSKHENHQALDIVESSHLHSQAHSWQDDTGSDLSMPENCPAQEPSLSSERQTARSSNSSWRKGKSKTRSRSKSHPRFRKISRKSSNKFMASIRVYVFTCGHACKVCNTPKAKEWLTESGFHFALPSAENDEDCHMESSPSTNAMSLNQNAENSPQNTASPKIGTATSLLKSISENDPFKKLSHYKIPSYPGQKTAIVETTGVGDLSRHMIVPIGKTVAASSQMTPASPVQTTVTLPSHAVRQSEKIFTKTADHHKQNSFSPGLIRFKPFMSNKNSSVPGTLYLKPISSTSSSLTSNTGFIQFQPISSVASSLSSNVNIVQLKPPAIPSSIISQPSLAHLKPISPVVPKGSFQVKHIISSSSSSLPSSPKVVQILSSHPSFGIIPMNSISSLPSTQNNVQMKTGSSTTSSLLSTQGIIQITSSSLPSTPIFTQITASSIPSTPKIVQIMSGSSIPSSLLSTPKVNQMKSVSSTSSSLSSTQGIIQSNSIPSKRVSSSAVPNDIQSTLDRTKIISVIQLPEQLSLSPIPPILAKPTSVKESVKLRQLSHTVSSHSSYQENVSSVAATVSDSNQVDFCIKTTSSTVTPSSSQGKTSTCPNPFLHTPVSNSTANSIPYDVTLISDGVDTSMKSLSLSSVITPESLQKNSTAVLSEVNAQGGKPFPTQMFPNRKNIILPEMSAPHNALPVSSGQGSVQVRPVSPVTYTAPASSPKNVEVETMPDLSLPLSLTEEGFRIELISDPLE